MYADPAIIKLILSLLAKRGWKAGLESVESEIRRTSDPAERGAKQFFLGWVAGEWGQHEEARRRFQEVAGVPDYVGWSLAGQAFIALREYDHARARQWLQEAEHNNSQNSPILKAAIAHCLGVICYHEDKIDEALVALREAFDTLAPDHFGTARVLDTLGMLYASKDDFGAAHAFYQKSLALKSQFLDEAGLALTHGNLGRLYLNWGLLDDAAEHFRIDYKIVSEMGDERGMAIMANWLG